MDRERFFNAIRSAPFAGNLSQSQVDGINAILDEWDRRKLTDTRWLAYMLATAFHEVGGRMQPVREGFKDTDAEARAYVAAQHYRYAVVINGRVYYGRGIAQLTWAENYQKMSALIGVDLVADPDKALELPIAVSVLFEGMIRGTFTGHRLADYINGALCDYVGARRIVNGSDRAVMVAGYAVDFGKALTAASDDHLVVVPARPSPPVILPSAPQPQPDDPGVPAPTGFWASFFAAFLAAIFPKGN